jgi:hypothetical protein
LLLLQFVSLFDLEFLPFHILLDKVLFYSNTNVNIVAHNREKLQEIFKRVKYTFEQIPDQIKLSD